jgi:hypothetical protein
MPNKLHVSLTNAAGDPENTITLEHDGAITKLTRVRRVVIDSGDAQVGDSPIAEITMWGGDVSSAEIVVSDTTAEAVLRLENQRALAFLSDVDVEALKSWFEDDDISHAWQRTPEGYAASAALHKIIAELARREPSSH